VREMVRAHARERDLQLLHQDGHHKVEQNEVRYTKEDGENEVADNVRLPARACQENRTNVNGNVFEHFVRKHNRATAPPGFSLLYSTKIKPLEGNSENVSTSAPLRFSVSPLRLFSPFLSTGFCFLYPSLHHPFSLFNTHLHTGLSHGRDAGSPAPRSLVQPPPLSHILGRNPAPARAQNKCIL
jgi:hypothetical protein